jgi:hypothetical protein
MPRFYFHVRDGDRLIADPDGGELPDLDAARAVAAAALRRAAAAAHGAAKAASGRRFEIADRAGRVLATVALWDVFGLH